MDGFIALWCAQAIACSFIGLCIFGMTGFFLGAGFGIFGVIIAAILSLHPDYKRAEKYRAARLVESNYNKELERKLEIQRAESEIKEKQEKQMADDKRMQEVQRKQREEEDRKIVADAMRREEEFRLKKERISKEYSKRKDLVQEEHDQ